MMGLPQLVQWEKRQPEVVCEIERGQPQVVWERDHLEGEKQVYYYSVLSFKPDVTVHVVLPL